VLAQVAQDSSTKDPVEMEVNLKDVVKFNYIDIQQNDYTECSNNKGMQP
jgi:hypothetical protein